MGCDDVVAVPECKEYINSRLPRGRNVCPYHFVLPNDGFKIRDFIYISYVRYLAFKDWNSLEDYARDEGVAICEKLFRKLRLKYNSSRLSDR
uniref:Uncharacterized protein n=1 Tax=Glossina morsitans morsitans TaxID=37546 RepID=A0A1B0FF21_GLOMM